VISRQRLARLHRVVVQRREHHGRFCGRGSVALSAMMTMGMSPKQKAQPQKVKIKPKAKTKIVSYDSDTSDTSSQSSSSMPNPKRRCSSRNSLDNEVPDPKRRRSPRNSLDNELMANPKRTYVSRYFEEPPTRMSRNRNCYALRLNSHHKCITSSIIG
jgi:hypothetical protein